MASFESAQVGAVDPERGGEVRLRESSRYAHCDEVYVFCHGVAVCHLLPRGEHATLADVANQHIALPVLIARSTISTTAAVIHVDRPNFSRMVRGIRAIPVDVLDDLVTHFDLDAEQARELLRWAAAQARALRSTRSTRRAA